MVKMSKIEPTKVINALVGLFYISLNTKEWDNPFLKTIFCTFPLYMVILSITLRRIKKYT